MVEVVEAGWRDIVVEAGPGKGALTKNLLAASREVIAVEKDERLVLYLQLKFRKEIAAGKLNLIGGDILEFQPSALRLKTGGYKVAANIPYYITGKFLRHFLSEVEQPSMMALMLQKEVADRIMATDGKESLLSLSVKAYGKPFIAARVPAGAFSPSPKVDSAVVLIRNISRDRFKDAEMEGRFFKIIHAGFRSKRKKLSGNLKTLFGETVKAALAASGVDENARAEDVPIEKWLRLASFINKNP